MSWLNRLLSAGRFCSCSRSESCIFPRFCCSALICAVSWSRQAEKTAIVLAAVLSVGGGSMLALETGESSLPRRDCRAARLCLRDARAEIGIGATTSTSSSSSLLSTADSSSVEYMVLLAPDDGGPQSDRVEAALFARLRRYGVPAEADL